MTEIQNMTKDELLIFLADSLLKRGSVTGEIKFGTDDRALDDIESRARAGNDEFRDIIDRGVELTGKEIEPDPRDARDADRLRRATEAAALRINAINKQIAEFEGGAN